ncbi:hypothetical protein ABL78_7959 [Leptomonas seymouri]|uniref:EF-hand domain-containing protein n=1 Tax=Leptomonas seymouri TaxID=5684 RepID=A0A0N1HYT7_LEPSE|nr:hypothetical protein ABL78_7959 [Leptomonas seymouri]|eukprot:KPI83021.1 hypothetical protein ABL78_7959 [Leptomonas seymouri]
MAASTDVVEKLAQHFFLTPTLVQRAAQLFDAYAQDDTATTEAETRISVKQLQQLLVALGLPLSQQDVIEILQLLGSAASSPLSAPATAGSTAMTAGTSASAAATGLANGSPRPPHALSTTSARKSNNNRHNTTSGTRNQPNKQAASSRHITSAPQTAATTDARVQEGSDPNPLEDPSVTTTSTVALEAAASTTGEDAQEGGSPLPTSAVNLHGMTFPAFLYFLLVYPTLVEHISKHTAVSASTSAFASVDVAELFAQLDSDSDGVCSAQDIRRVAERCATDYDGLLLDDPDLCRLAAMHPVELEEAIREFDLDEDGVVTLADLRQALQ